MIIYELIIINYIDKIRKEKLKFFLVWVVLEDFVN